MKKFNLVICLLLVLSLMLCACKSEPAKETESLIGISFVNENISILPGETAQLECELEDEKSIITYSTSNAAVCTVSEQGVLLGVAPGTATVTASIGEYEKAYLQVTVNKDVMISGVYAALNKESLELVTGLEFTLSCTAKKDGTDLSGTQVKWSSSDETVASVVDGKVTAVAPGNAIIFADVTADNQSFNVSCSVTVHEPYHIELDKTYVESPVGGKFTLSATIHDANGNLITPEKHELEWITSDPSAITINESTFHVISKGTPSVGVCYKGNVASIPVEIFAVSAEFFQSGISDFYGEVGGETFSGVVYNSTAYQPRFYFSADGMDRIRQYAEEKGLNTLRIHSYAILLNNSFRINGRYVGRDKWMTVDVPVSELTDDFWFMSESEGVTEVYMWFELR